MQFNTHTNHRMSRRALRNDYFFLSPKAFYIPMIVLLLMKWLMIIESSSIRIHVVFFIRKF